MTTQKKRKSLVVHAGDKVRNVMTVERTSPGYGEYQGEVLRLANGFIRYSFERSAGDLMIRHPWGRDDEGDRCFYFCMPVYSLQTTLLVEGQERYTAWVGPELKMFTPETDPYVSATKSDDDEDNWDYPYQPPEVDFKNVFGKSGPLMVTLTNYRQGEYNLKDFLKDES
jgi:hypothetical protein